MATVTRDRSNDNIGTTSGRLEIAMLGVKLLTHSPVTRYHRASVQLPPMGLPLHETSGQSRCQRTVRDINGIAFLLSRLGSGTRPAMLSTEELSVLLEMLNDLVKQPLMIAKKRAGSMTRWHTGRGVAFLDSV